MKYCFDFFLREHWCLTKEFYSVHLFVWNRYNECMNLNDKEAHLSWKFNWSELFWSPVVRPSVCNYKLFTISSSSSDQNHMANINQIGTKHPWVKGIQVSSNENKNEIAKIHWRTLKIFFSRTTNPISTKQGTKRYWDKGMQVWSNERLRLYPRGYNYVIAKTHWWKISTTLDQFQPNFAQSLIYWSGFK